MRMFHRHTRVDFHSTESYYGGGGAVVGTCLDCGKKKTVPTGVWMRGRSAESRGQIIGTVLRAKGWTPGDAPGFNVWVREKS